MVWPVDPEYHADYIRMVEQGRAVAGDLTVSIVAIARNAMPHITNTLALIDELRAGWKASNVYIYENDSVDGTAQVLDEHLGVVVEHDSLGGEDARGFEPERTIRLAHCRNRCLDRGVSRGSSVTIVLDTDPPGGFSVDGVFNSVAWLAQKRSEPSAMKAGGMASYSLFRRPDGVAHYDAWAARPPSWWRDRRNEIGFLWFSSFLPPVGSPPCPMNSAFGGLGVYWTEAILSGRYEGGDCEHVALHRSMAKAGWQMFLNPGCRYISVWEE
jgi:hypothetical protein